MHLSYHLRLADGSFEEVPMGISRNDKNLAGILSRVDANTMQMVLFTDAKELEMGSAPRLAEQITFAVKRQTTTEF